MGECWTGALPEVVVVDSADTGVEEVLETGAEVWLVEGSDDEVELFGGIVAELV